jgi:hypothetical protein
MATRPQIRYTAKQWTITIWVIDALGIALLIFVGYLTWSFYHRYGKVESFFSLSTLVGLVLFIWHRGVATTMKREAEQAESNTGQLPPLTKT